MSDAAERTEGDADDATASGDAGGAAASEYDADRVPGRPCPHCGASMTRRHCKYVCPEHGVVWDCSDTFY